MAQIIDKIVNIQINDAISSVETTDVNTVAIVGASNVSDATASVVSSSDEAKTAFGDGSELHKMAQAFFGQETCPSKLVCIPGTLAGIETAVENAAKDFDFYHICANGDAVPNGINSWLVENHKLLHVQGDFSANTETNTRVALYKHTVDGEYLNVAIVASRCGLDSARGTFAHKTVTGITSDSYGVTEYENLIDAGINIYTKVAGTSRLFMGTTCSNTDFIDNYIKDDWIRFNVQSKIFTLLGEANDGAGLTYNDAGIAAVAAAITQVFNVANSTGREYIMDNYSVSYKDYEYLKENNAEDVNKRNLPLVTGTYQRMNSIHTVDQVTLTVTL